MAGAYSSVDAYFAAYFLAMGQGRLRRPGELARLLKQAGFWKIARRRTRMPMLARVMVAVVAPATSGAGPYAGPYSGP